MKTLNIRYEEDYAVIQLDRGSANPINQLMIDEMQQMLQEMRQNDQVKGIILTGKPHFFTAGVDLLEVYHYDSDATRHFWGSFIQLAADFSAFPKPAIAAITGHSPAGGCIWACCCDYRIMAKGDKYRIGLNEIAVGIAPRESILHLYAFWIGKRRAYQFLLEGRLLSGQEAFDYGLVDELVDLEEVLARATTKLQQYTKLPPKALQQTKQALKKEVADNMLLNFEEDLDRLHQQLLSDESRHIMGQVVKALEARKKG